MNTCFSYPRKWTLQYLSSYSSKWTLPLFSYSSKWTLPLSWYFSKWTLPLSSYSSKWTLPLSSYSSKWTLPLFFMLLSSVRTIHYFWRDSRPLPEPDSSGLGWISSFQHAGSPRKHETYAHFITSYMRPGKLTNYKASIKELSKIEESPHQLFAYLV